MILCLLLAVSVFAEQHQAYQGVWWWTWTQQISGLDTSRTNIAIAFSGWTNPDQAKASAAPILGNLPGLKFISLGGGNDNGRWTASDITATTSACNSRSFGGYNGIAFDIEEGDANLNFAPCFAACKAAGYLNLVTSSHSAPYGITDAARLMRSFFSDRNIDFLSPQLYTSGSESSNDYTTTAGVAWSEYAGSSAKIVPAIVTGSYYPDAQTQFAKYGVTTVGYIQWAQIMSYPAGGSVPVPVTRPVPTGGSGVPCGSSTCDPGQCCSQWGYCGYTSDYCGAGCRAGCSGGSAPVPVPRPVPVPVPVPVGNGNVCSPPCASGLCCSKWGYCGTGAAYCASGARLESDDPNQGGGLSAGALAAIVVCSVLVAVLIIGLALFMLLRKKQDSDAAERV